MPARLGAGIRWLAGAKSSGAAVAHTLSARIGVTAINFATGVLVARSLEAHGRGEQAAVSIWPIVLSGLLTLGLPTALRYYVPREREAAGAFLTVALGVALALGAIAAAAGAAFIPQWLTHYDPASVRFAQWMMLFAPGYVVMLVLQGYFEARGSFAQSNAAVYLPTLATLAALGILASTHRMTPYASSIAYLAPTTLLAAQRLFSLRGEIRWRVEGFGAKAKRLLGYGGRAFGIDVLTTLSTQIDQALVVRFLTASDLGIYTVGLAVSRLLTIFGASLNAVLLPKASALESRGAIALVSRAARITLAVTACAAAAAALAIPIVLPFFYGRDFVDSTRIAQILFAEVTLNTTVFVLAQAFLSTGRPGVVTALQGVGLLATVPFMLFAIPRFGLIGAAFALLASTTLRLAFVMACFPVLLRTRPPSLLVTLDDIRFVKARLRFAPATENDARG